MNHRVRLWLEALIVISAFAEHQAVHGPWVVLMAWEAFSMAGRPCFRRRTSRHAFLYLKRGGRCDGLSALDCPGACQAQWCMHHTRDSVFISKALCVPLCARRYPPGT
ncbi:hypothetical protein PENSPDRAFT_199050 [Peniophora sp. CONT]|nr:hypothetical protein PENSPDRAFT_199050 [Peniophora sp. CONT]